MSKGIAWNSRVQLFKMWDSHVKGLEWHFFSLHFFLAISSYFLFPATHLMNEHSHNIFVVLIFIMIMHQVIVVVLFLLCFPKFSYSIQVSNLKKEYWFFKPWTFLLGSFFGLNQLNFPPKRCDVDATSNWFEWILDPHLKTLVSIYGS